MESAAATIISTVSLETDMIIISDVRSLEIFTKVTITYILRSSIFVHSFSCNSALSFNSVEMIIHVLVFFFSSNCPNLHHRIYFDQIYTRRFYEIEYGWDSNNY